VRVNRSETKADLDEDEDERLFEVLSLLLSSKQSNATISSFF